MAKLSQAKSNSNPDIGGKAFLYREKEFRKKESSKTHLSSSTSHREFEDLPSFRGGTLILRVYEFLIIL